MSAAPVDTPRGREGKDFPSTPWTSVFAEPDSPRRRERLEAFCRAYWRPVFQFIRTVGGEQTETVKDRTQEFFEHFIEADLLTRYRPQEGRFRQFLKGSLRNFLSQARRDEGRLKRGGDRTFVPLDAGEGTLPLENAGQLTPDQLFDRQWVDDILTGSVRRLRSLLEAQGKGVYFQLYEAYELSPDPEAPSYAELAARFGLQPHDVENRLSHCRQLLRKLILEAVAEYASSPEELVEEMKDILRG
jgi:DNA-directed RNA polymerase specialized sigma24 family protein